MEMLKFFCHVTGDDHNLVKNETPASKRKIALMASAVFVPVILWLVSSFLLVFVVMQGHWVAAILTALFVGAIIFIIERTIIMSNGSNWIAGFRVCLGFLVAILGSIIIDEVVFKGDIDAKVAENKQAFVNAKANEYIDSKKEERNKLERDVAYKDSLTRVYDNETMNEASGRSGTGRWGVGEVTKLKSTIADKSRIDHLEAVAALSKFDEGIKADTSNLRTVYNLSFSEHSLLTRIKAMFELVFSDLYMGLIYLLFTLILFFLEFLVVIIKMCMPKSSYEFKLELQEKINKHNMERMYQKHMEMYQPEQHIPYQKKVRGLLDGLSMNVF